MSNRIDCLVLFGSFSAFPLFLLLHAFSSRLLPRWPINQSIIFSFLFSFLVLFIFSWRVDYGFVAGMTSWVIYSLLFFHYLVWVFGMGEAAIRIRLLRELDIRPTKRATLQEIMANYDAAKILDYRLSRLVGSGHLAFDGKFYSIKNRILLLQLFISNTMKRILGMSVSK